MADLMTIQEVAMDALCGDELPSTRRYVRADLYAKLEAELAAARERASRAEGALAGLMPYVGRPAGRSMVADRINRALDRAEEVLEAAPTAAHTGGGEDSDATP